MTVGRDQAGDPEAVPPSLLRRYLKARGWRQPAARPRSALSAEVLDLAQPLLDARPSAQRTFDLFVHSEEGYEDVELVLPRERSEPDFLRRIERAVATLCAMEAREPRQVVADIRAMGFDAVHASIPGGMVHDDTIHLEIAANYTAGIKGLLAATATTEIQPTPYFLRLRKDATEYAERCRFGHTFRGSFGFTIESLVQPNDDPALPDMEHTPPFERRVVQRLARGIRSVCRAVASDDLSPITSNAALGFSANACEMFANLVESTAHSGLFFAFMFSPEWRAAEDLRADNSFVVGPGHVEATRAAAKALRSTPISRPETVFGRVTWLQSQDDPTDLLAPAGSRAIAVQWSSEDLGDVSVEVALGAADYLLALHAHGTGRPIRVSGTLEKKGRRWVLSDPTEFSVP